MPDFRIAYRPFPQQQAYFRRKVNMPSARWDDLMHGEHAHGFMAAGVARMDVLEDIRQAVQDAIDRGEGFPAFQARMRNIIADKGWIGGAGDESEARRAWRMRMIYQTNLRTSYMAGRWEDLQKFPYLRYQHNTINNPRHEHQAWDGLVLASDDPWWDTHYPPNGWGCRCTVTGVGKGRMRVLGKDGPDAAPGPSEGDPPPEWAYHPGKAARSLPAAESFGRKVMALPPEWRKAVLDDAQSRRVEWFGDFVPLVAQVRQEIAAGRTFARGYATPVGFVPNDIIDVLATGVGERAASGAVVTFSVPTLSTALVALNDRALYHSLRDHKAVGRPGIRDTIAREVDTLPYWVSDPETIVLYEPARTQAIEMLVFARALGGGRYATLHIDVGMREERTREPVLANWVRTVEIKTRQQLGGFIKLRGEW